MAWQKVAEGVNLWDLRSTVGELELPKGSRLRVEMDLKMPLGWAFDVAGAEGVFRPFTPEGMKLIDVYGEGSRGIVEMEADPAWLLAFLAFIKVHWVAILIASLVLGAIVAMITVLVKIAAAPTLPVATLAIIGGLVLLGVMLLPGRRREA